MLSLGRTQNLQLHVIVNGFHTAQFFKEMTQIASAFHCAKKQKNKATKQQMVNKTHTEIFKSYQMNQRQSKQRKQQKRQTTLGNPPLSNKEMKSKQK
jgi:hypothetical protein